MKFTISILILLSAASCSDRKDSGDQILASGQVPALVKDSNSRFHIVYGKGDSLLYSFSSDEGITFTSPQLIAIVPSLVASHTRGPQIAITSRGPLVTACNVRGNIFSFIQDAKGNWQQGLKVNDEDTVAKEGFQALAADDQNVFIAWLDLRGDHHNKIFGATSSDGGLSWSGNFLVYASPDSSVCECCKPSAAMKGNDVFVMFRNWLDHNRDLYLVHSVDGGKSFGEAQKLGRGSWMLDGCPMDGGGMALDESGVPQTTWNRKGVIYACAPGKAEERIGEGRSCAIASINGRNIYAWIEKGEVVVLTPGGTKKDIGRGELPVIKAIDSDRVLCIWENEKQIHRAVLPL